MLTIEESTCNNPAGFICECGQRIVPTLHHDYLDACCCSCGRTHYVKTDIGIWNCCSFPENDMVRKAAREWKQARDKWLPIIRGANGIDYLVIAQQELAQADDRLEATLLGGHEDA
jgi:hypothetical protein